MSVRGCYAASAVTLALLATVAVPAQADPTALLPPSNVRATYNSLTHSVSLSWQPPGNDTTTSYAYKVYRNGVLLDTVPGLSFVDPAATASVLLYEITANSAQGESAPATVLLVWPPPASQSIGRLATVFANPASAFLQQEGIDVLPCALVVVGWNPNFPYVAQIDDDCIAPLFRI